VNDVYGSFFEGEDPPAAGGRYGVAALPKGADVEVDAIVAL
jgi:enamine deaminase RidA (YjgF/YER057c/UK114 family)